MSIVVAAMIGSVITGKVTNKWGKRQACLGSLLFIVVGLAVMALSTTSANYYLMAAGQCICGLGGWAWDCPPCKVEAWNAFSINKQTVKLLSFLLSSSWGVFWELEFLVRSRDHGMQQHVREPLQKLCIHLTCL